MKILAFAASNNKQSINKQLVIYTSNLMKDADIEILDINDYEMPLYSEDREKAHGIPDLAHAFYKKIGNAEGLLIAYAEHNGIYSAAYKNLFDWTSRISQKVYQSKPMIILSTSPGPGGAKNVLALAKTSAPHFGGDIKADISIPNFYDNFDQKTGEISDTEMKALLLNAVSKLIDH